jgi:hypothetical protein
MKNSSMETWVGVSWVMTAVVVISAVIVCSVFGVVEVPTGAYAKKSVIVWPVIAGSIASAMFSVLFSVVVRATTIAAINSRTTLGLLLAEAKETEKAQN